MKKIIYALGLLLALSVISCVTINIYFPAEEIRGAADKIVNEVWGEGNNESDQATPPAEKPGSGLWDILQPASAFAAQDINVSTPEIRAIKASIKQRSGALFGYLDSGNVGIGGDGLLKIRNTDGLNLKQRGEINKLVNAENQDRQRLYQEIAVANGFPDKVGEVQAIFADSWREQAKAGWFSEAGDGSWSQK